MNLFFRIILSAITLFLAVIFSVMFLQSILLFNIWGMVLFPLLAYLFGLFTEKLLR